MKILTKQKIEYLIYLLNIYKLANKYSPFPIYEPYAVNKFERIINIMKEQDLEEVECCLNCKSLFLFEDDEDENKIWCGKCDSLNKIEKLPNINYWKRQYGDIWI